MCVMPNASQRITDSTIKGMISMFFMFNSLDERIDISLHPKYHIIINNVSRFGDDYDLEKIEKDPDNAQINTAANLSVEKRILDIKAQLKESTKSFFLTEEISENSRIGDKIWKDIKEQICRDDTYRELSWFTEMT